MRANDIRGVNLGGWLVLEKWITPSLFEDIKGQDEFSLSTELGVSLARKRLDNHRKSFITKHHIRQISRMGLNVVRVPVGYWLFDDRDGFIGGGYKYIDRLFRWTDEFGIKVILCLHGAPGSQNGWDHSGRAGDIGWTGKKQNLQDTLGAIKELAARYGRKENLWGIEVVNEPHPSLSIRVLARYYRKAGRIVKRLCHREVRWVVSDAFRPDSIVWRMLLHRFRRPVLDQHLYQLFTDEDRALDFEGHMRKVISWGGELKKRRRWMPIIIGEWSAAMDELYLPDLSKNARQYTKEQYQKYARTQQAYFETAGCGWIYWTARTEDAGVWSLLDNPDFVK